MNNHEIAKKYVNNNFTGALVLRVPLRQLSYTFTESRTSPYVSIPDNQSTTLKLDIGEVGYTIDLIRARVASNGQGEHPDPYMYTVCHNMCHLYHTVML